MIYEFFVNSLFGNIWFAVIAIGAFYSTIGVLGKINMFMLITLLSLYFMTMGVIFGGLAVWILIMLGSAIYFAIQMIKYFE